MLAELGVSGISDAAGSNEWDVDLYRRPRGLVSGAGTVDEGKLGEEIRGDASRLTRSVAVLAVLARAPPSSVRGRFASAATRRVRMPTPHHCGDARHSAWSSSPFSTASRCRSPTPTFNRTGRSPTSGLGSKLQTILATCGDPKTEGGRVFHYRAILLDSSGSHRVDDLERGGGVTLVPRPRPHAQHQGLASAPGYRLLRSSPWRAQLQHRRSLQRHVHSSRSDPSVFSDARRRRSPGSTALDPFPGGAPPTAGCRSRHIVGSRAPAAIPSSRYEAARGTERRAGSSSAVTASLKPALVPAVILL